MSNSQPFRDSIPGGELSDEQWLERVANSRGESDGQQLGSYRVIDEVARGGQGIVFRGRDVETGELVALKTLIGGEAANSQQRDRLRREHATIDRLDHCGIVKSRGLIEEGGCLTLVFEWIDGLPVDTWAATLDEERRVETVLPCFVLICRAVQHAHERGVIHRDLKPSNILVNAEGKPFVLDFGVARDAEIETGERLTRTGDFLGSPPYASPEQLQLGPRAVDERSDIYSLGVTLYLQLTGCLPIDVTADPAGPANAVQMQSVPLPTSLVADLPSALDSVLLEALSKDRTWRYSSVRELAADVERVISGRPVRANPNRAARLLAEESLRVDSTAIVTELLRSLRTHSVGFERSRSQVIERALRSAEERLRDSPATQATLLEEIADVQLDEGDGAGAVRTLRRSFRLWESTGDSVRVLQSDHVIVKALIRTGLYDEAERYLEEALSRVVSQGLVGDRAHIALMKTAAELHLMRGDWERAEEKSAALASLLPSDPGTREYVDGRFLEYRILSVQGRYAEGKQLMLDLLEESEGLLGPREDVLARARRCYGFALMENGELARAVIEFERVLTVRREIGSDPGLIAEALVDLAQMKDFELEHDRAEQLLTEAIDVLGSLETGHHEIAGLALCYRGKIRRVLGRTEDGLADLDQALSLQRNQLGPAHPSVALTLAMRASAVGELGNLEEARSLLQEALEAQTKILGPDHRNLADMLNSHAITIQQHGHYEEALSYFLRALEHLKRTFSIDSQYLILMHNNIGRLHVDIKDVDSARESYQSALSCADRMNLPEDNLHRRKTLVGLQFVRLLEIEQCSSTDASQDCQPQLAAVLEELTRLEVDAAVFEWAHAKVESIQRSSPGQD